MKKALAMFCASAMIMGSLAGCSGKTQAPAESAGAPAETKQAANEAASGDTLISLITMDSIDQHWVTLNEGDRKSVV